jgi:Transposase IS116/IS110/IS902 family
LIAVYDGEVGALERDIHAHLRHHRGYEAIQAITGLGRSIAAIAGAEIGDVERFPGPDALGCWAGLTPQHRESDLKAHRREISKQGSRLLRWALVEGSARYHGGPRFSASFQPSPSGVAPTGPGSRSLARSSRSSTTGCATARSAASPGRLQREGSDTTRLPARPAA